ncbi:MAG: hypothetical protein J5J06_16210 [Phycisphaerae bacterium]|nr:hypothetical protein [Phycisphaerae bacterium]
MNQEPRKPIKEFRAGTVKAAIWKQENETEGRIATRYSVRIQKRFHDRATGDWCNTDYFFVNDLPRLRLVAEQSYQFIALHESEDAQDEDSRG